MPMPVEKMLFRTTQLEVVHGDAIFICVADYIGQWLDLRFSEVTNEHQD